MVLVPDRKNGENEAETETRAEAKTKERPTQKLFAEPFCNVHCVDSNCIPTIVLRQKDQQKKKSSSRKPSKNGNSKQGIKVKHPN